jgi:hypothetical protein
MALHVSSGQKYVQFAGVHHNRGFFVNFCAVRPLPSVLQFTIVELANRVLALD